jgi:hypothetical protein
MARFKKTALSIAARKSNKMRRLVAGKSNNVSSGTGLTKKKHVVDKIQDHKYVGDHLFYNVLWEGGDSTWQSREQLQKDIPDMVFNYENYDATTEWKVKEVVETRITGTRTNEVLEVKVWWLGFAKEDASWEPADSIPKHFWEHLKDAPAVPVAKD